MIIHPFGWLPVISIYAFERLAVLCEICGSNYRFMECNTIIIT